MPREQAIIKLKEFSERAIKEFDIALLNSLAKNANPSLVTQKSGSTIMSAKYMVCVTMLLAARLGEHELLLNQVEKMQPFIEAHINNIDSVRPPEIRGVFSPEVSRKIASLEDDCILSVLIYACEQAQIDWNWLFYRTCSC